MLMDMRALSPQARAALTLLRRPWTPVLPKKAAALGVPLDPSAVVLRQDSLLAVCTYLDPRPRTKRFSHLPPFPTLAIDSLTLLVPLSRAHGADIPDVLINCPVLCTKVPLSFGQPGYHVGQTTALALSRAFLHERFVKGNRALAGLLIHRLYAKYLSPDYHLAQKIVTGLRSHDITLPYSFTAERLVQLMPVYSPDEGWAFSRQVPPSPTSAHGLAVLYRLLHALGTADGQRQYFS